MKVAAANSAADNAVTHYNMSPSSASHAATYATGLPCIEATGCFRETAASLTGDERESAQKSRKFPCHRRVNRAPERHDQRGDVRKRLPAPGVELRLLAVAPGRHGNFALLAGEATREPPLALAAERAKPVRWAVIRRKVVGEPVRGLAGVGDRRGRGLFVE